ncbi:MAG: hypothetical protein LBC18_05655, partial [Opitutaceae bacterium]|nr:hypothetical protein [Opitutaceae bacterium]
MSKKVPALARAVVFIPARNRDDTAAAGIGAARRRRHRRPDCKLESGWFITDVTRQPVFWQAFGGAVSPRPP